MWITRRIGKNDGKKTAMDWLLFSKKCIEDCMVLSDTGVLKKNIHAEWNIKWHIHNTVFSTNFLWIRFFSISSLCRNLAWVWKVTYIVLISMVQQLQIPLIILRKNTHSNYWRCFYGQDNTNNWKYLYYPIVILTYHFPIRHVFPWNAKPYFITYLGVKPFANRDTPYCFSSICIRVFATVSSSVFSFEDLKTFDSIMYTLFSSLSYGFKTIS